MEQVFEQVFIVVSYQTIDQVDTSSVVADLFFRTLQDAQDYVGNTLIHRKDVSYYAIEALDLYQPEVACKR